MIGDLLIPVALPMLAFAAFVVLTLCVRQGDTPGTSAPLRMLICYVVAVSMYAGFSGRDLWPFAAWRYVSYAIGDSGNFVRVVGVDASGREHPLDTRTFEPLEFGQVIGNLEYGIEHMPRAHQTEFLDFLLRRAQEGLAHARAGRPVGTFARFLGPLSAPTFQVAPTPWMNRDNLPSEFTELRLYRIYWHVSGAAIHIENQVLVASTQS